jgi:Uncharacterized conserved protein
MYLYPFKIFALSKEKRILKDNGSYGGIYDAAKDNYINTKEKAESTDAKISILLGEVANGVKLICLDLDDCFLSDGSIEPDTKELLKEFDDNEWEVSSSGEGIHVYILTKLDLETFIVKEMEGCKSFECYTNKRHIVTTTFDFLGTNLLVGAHDEFIKTLYDKVKSIQEAKNPSAYKDIVKNMFDGKEIQSNAEIFGEIYGRKPVTDMYTLRGCGFKDSTLIELIDTEPSTVDQSAHDAALIRKLMYYTFSFEAAWELAKKTNYYKHKDEFHQKKFNTERYKERTRKFLGGC